MSDSEANRDDELQKYPSSDSAGGAEPAVAPPGGQPPRNDAARYALILALFSLICGWAAIPAVVYGWLGWKRASRFGGAGKGMAIAGLTIGGIVLVVAPILTTAAVIKVRYNAAIAKSKNDVKQIGIAFQSYHDIFNRLPTPYFQPDATRSVPADPAQRLSWRVGLVPFLEATNFYVDFKPEEAWDGPTNGPIGRITFWPYHDPGREAAEPNNQTPYRVFVGGGAIFDTEKPTKKLSELANGTSNAVLFVEAEQTVPWTQYNELPFDPAGPLPPLGAPHRDVFLAGMADGSVRTVKKSISPQVLKAAITAGGGEQIPVD